ncbi:YbaN family protein [Gemmatimonadota bacterium]
MGSEVVRQEREIAKGRATRLGWILVGHACLGVGLLGLAVPLLPTTPFVLLAAACYVRGSRRFYTYLLTHRVFGSIIRDWHEYRAISSRAKRWAIACVFLSITASILVVGHIWLQLVLVLIGLLVIAGLLRIPVRKERDLPG